MHKCRYWILLSLFISACPSSENADVQQERDVSFIEADVRSDLRGADVSTPDVSINSSDVNVVGVDVATPPECDYETRGGIVVIEAEDLTLSEEWARETSVAGASGGAYISWNGQSFNNDPTHGLISVDINFTQSGRYILEWRSRIGRGDNPTEHNDTWVRFQTLDFYGIQGPANAEDRVYPRPLCEDADFIAGVVAQENIVEASCPAGSSRDGWFKGYSSGALDWRFITKTSDSDAHDIVADVGAPGVHTLELAARADFNLIDRIVIRRESVARDDARDLGLATTECD